jgi:hypothetical protein
MQRGNRLTVEPVYPSRGLQARVFGSLGQASGFLLNYPMKTDISDVERDAANSDVLASVASEISHLEQMFADLTSLESERDRLTATVQNLHSEEAQILQETTNEAAIIKKLTTTRGARDVQSARLVNVQDKLAAHRIDLVDQGGRVRRSFAAVMAQIWTARQQRVSAMLSELFGGLPFIRLRTGRVTLRELTDQAAPMIQLKDVSHRVSHAIGDPVQETAGLLRSRTWLSDVADLVRSETTLTLRTVPAKQQPIEQPAAEMAAV